MSVPATETASSASAQQAQDAVIDIDVACPECGYNLRRLVQPRCPECGRPFEWAAVFEADRLRSACPLFEYHCRRKPLRSLLGTLVRVCYPPALWRCVRPEFKPRVGPLLCFASIATLLAAGIWVAAACFYRWAFVWWPVASPVTRLVQQFVVQAGCGLVIWLALQLFWQTRARSALRQAHLLRVVLLAWAGMLIWRQVLVLADTSLVVACWRLFGWRGRFFYASIYTWCERLQEWLPLGVLVWSLCLGLSRCLPWTRGVRLGLTTVLLIGAALCVAVIVVSVQAYDTFENPMIQPLRRTWPATAHFIETVLLRLLWG